MCTYVYTHTVYIRPDMLHKFNMLQTLILLIITYTCMCTHMYTCMYTYT